LKGRLIGMLAAMGLRPHPAEAAAWAAATDRPPAARGSEESITDPIPGIVVTYDADFDDLAVVNTSLPSERVRVDTDAIPWSIARRVVETLADQGIIEPSLSIDTADIAFVRSGVKGPDGSHEQWVDEVLFEVNTHVEGIPLLDAGLRIGVTPAGDVSYLRVTSIDVERLDEVTIQTSSDDLQSSFAEHFDRPASTLDSVTVVGRRPVYLLEPDVASAIVEPLYLLSYSITVRDEEALTVSRTSIILLSMTSPRPTVELRLPQRSELPRPPTAPP
jgi:hypothetical protein